MDSGVEEAKLTLRRVVGKFALLFAFVYLLALFAGVVTLLQGDEVPVTTWILLIPAGVAFVPAVIDAVNLHRTQDPDRLSKLWKRCGVLAVTGMVLLVVASLVTGGING
ncbi:hypothetical protein BJY16_004235 [Actinoplanes octamycinicus]|uniref:Transmembrane protein n=1 Tax=Actinoplanes octamycinicus TaxID=135948 RepID=A0A7W7M8G6_9ACTN|nr:hypothetical protein [Actinoplanes octamycinicus]MBB4740776.1 hypothetical protein [Actinoplanes octamycinicus]GIE61685.1 hypothetical protein Aoc01nite_70870 [Actinoplanes octamycinicus]